MIRRMACVLVALFCLGALASGQGAPVGGAPSMVQAGLEAAGPGPLEEGRLSTAVEIALLLTVLSLLPAVLVTLTSFTRIVIVLSFVRRALSVNDLPPNPVLLGLALFLTLFVMSPVIKDVQTEAWDPYQSGEKSVVEAGESAWGVLSKFLVANTRPTELTLFGEMAYAAEHGPQEEGSFNPAAFKNVSKDEALNMDVEAQLEHAASLPMNVVIPAFVLSELKTAFQMGFLLFLPFLVIDLVVSSVLLSMGMFMLPPVMISTPIKVLVFVLVDGWHLIAESVVTSFAV
ncbi:MAG: flagellar biosynthetic protein FliP [Planctomycetota bacterium]|jgi:flagellar biosynthetic protein FliP